MRRVPEGVRTNTCHEWYAKYARGSRRIWRA